MDLAKLSVNNKPARKQPAGIETMIYGKVPPQKKDLERIILGACMIEKYALAEILDLLTPAKFYLESHQHIFQAMINLDMKSQPVDIMTVSEEVLRAGHIETVGGAYYIMKLTDDVVSSANIVNHARIVHQAWVAREVIRVGGEMVGAGYDEQQDPFDLLDMAEKGISGIMDSSDRGKITSIDTAIARGMTRLYNLREQDSSMTGVPTGFAALDQITHGWQNTDLVILAARPAVGKTAFALNLLINAALHPTKPTPAAFFSLEMSESQLIERILSSETEVPLDLIKTGRLDDNQMAYILKNGASKLSGSPIFIDDTPALNIFELRAKCRRLKMKYKIGFILIDYLQLMSGTGKKGGNREQEISEISRSLKGLAKELGVPIIALSQLSRGVENRTDKTPQLADLRESGAIEQDADMVMFLYRPEYYGLKEDENGTSTLGETHVKIAKHRNGSLETIKLTAKLHIQKFVDFEGQPFAPPVASAWKQVRTPYREETDSPF